MNYVISDLHGRYDLFLRLLEMIRFNEADTLFFLGDAVDRGPDGVTILQDKTLAPTVPIVVTKFLYDS